MAKKQTRRGVSLSRKTYDRLMAFCVHNDVSMSSVVEAMINDYLDRPPPAPPRKRATPAEARIETRRDEAAPASVDKTAYAIFTF